jgi:glycerol-3-phosphate cytidylyltransferase
MDIEIAHGTLGTLRMAKRKKAKSKRRRQIVGVTAGAMDLCHAGHILMLREAKSVCDRLIVLLHVDPSVAPAEYRGKKKNVPIMSFEERKIILEAIKYVDEVIPYETEDDLLNLLIKIKPDIRIVGADWKGKQYTGWDLPIQMYFNSRNHTFSTTELRKRIYEAEKAKLEGGNGMPA